MTRAMLVLGLLAACHAEPESDAVEPRPVLSIVVAASPRPDRPFVGTIEARRTADIAFRIGGRVVRREVSIGDAVKRGQVIAELDRRSLVLAVNAGVADVAGLVARREDAATDLERQNELLQYRAIARTSLDDSKTTHAVAAAMVDEASARLRKSREQLDDSVLRAELDGVVTRVDFEVEQIVAPDVPIAQIVNPDVLDFVFDAPESTAQDLRIGDSFVVYDGPVPKQTTSATIRQIAPSADRITRTRRVWLALDPAPKHLRIGSICYGLRRSAQTPVIRVPSNAVVTMAGTSQVWVVEQDRVRPRSVTLGARTDQDVEVLAGLHDGERVVTAGIHSLSRDQRIKPGEELVQ